MRTGDLRQYIAIQTRTTAADAYGEMIETWATTTSVWAAIWPVSGKEQLQSQQIRADVTHTIRIRYYSGLSPVANQFLFGTRVFRIVSVRNVDERNIYQDCQCVEEVTA